MMESFLVAREFLAFCKTRRLPAILYKVEFEKAFNTVEWCFLTNLLIERGFPSKWIGSVLAILGSATSAVRVNGAITDSFSHGRGLRQGDPLSSMLFIIIADSLNSFMRNAEQAMPHFVHMHPKTIQFADDTVIISEANPLTLKIITQILKVYEELLGLKVNKANSAFVPVSIPQNLIHPVQNIMSSPPVELPITYLGLPLSIKKLRIVDYQAMVQSVQRKMEGWKSNFLSYGGRVTLVKAVLSAMPIHYMQATRLPKGIIKQIDKIRRQFLWRGNAPCKGINCLMNWETICTLKCNGGMG